MRSLSLALIVGVSVSYVLAYGQPDRNTLINGAIANEHAIVKATDAGRPLVETYFQFYNSQDSAPVSDRYYLSELSPKRLLGEDPYDTPREGGLSKQALQDVSSVIRGNTEKFLVENFADMISPDARGFNRGNYVFHYVKTSFIGNRRVEAFDVFPRDKKHSDGRFIGRIWVDQRDQVIVRFTGVFESHSSDFRPEYIHFDSWRKKSADTDQWRPYAIYIEDQVRGQVVKGQIRLWAYNVKQVQNDSSNVDIHVNDADDRSNSSQDVSPLESARLWREQAEDNVLDRLEKEGILARPGTFEKMLDQVVTNLEVPNNLNFSEPVDVRILLTLPIEATVINHTILISKGLIDTIPNEETLASVIALELAHVQLGHHLDTMFAFNDRLAFTNDSTYMHLCFSHSYEDNRAAAKLAVRYLKKSMYKDNLGKVANYYAILVNRESSLKALSRGYLGDSLLGPDGKPWISAALPATTLKCARSFPLEEPTSLSSMLSVDTDSDTLSQILPREAPGPGETPHSLEIMPMWLNLKNDDGMTVTAHLIH